MEGDYDAAMHEANQIRWPGYVVGPLLRATVLGKMGKNDEARPEIAEVLKLAPYFRQVGKRALGKLYYQHYHVDAIVSGLQCAGLNLN